MKGKDEKKELKKGKRRGEHKGERGRGGWRGKGGRSIREKRRKNGEDRKCRRGQSNKARGETERRSCSQMCRDRGMVQKGQE